MIKNTDVSILLLRVNLFLFAFFSIFTFFSSDMWGGHEIIPYYFVFAICIFLLKKNNSDNGEFLEVLTFFWLLLGCFFLDAVYLVDYLQVVIVLLTIFTLRQLDAYQKRKIANYFLILTFLIVVFMAMQKICPSLIDFVYSHLTIRDSTSEDLEAYTGGVLGIAPEPAYMGSYLIGVWMYVVRFNQLQHNKITAVVLLGLALSASLSANLMFFCLFLLRLNSIKSALQIFFMGTVFLMLLFALDSSLFERFFDFYNVVIDSSDLRVLQNVDMHFGSYRISTLYEPLTKFGCGVLNCSAGYLIGYSLFAKLFYLIAPFHFFIFPLLFKWASGRDGILSFVTLIAFGPVLNWMLYSGLINRDDDRPCQG